jgi:hypothetical protein
MTLGPITKLCSEICRADCEASAIGLCALSYPPEIRARVREHYSARLIALASATDVRRMLLILDDAANDEPVGDVRA